MMMESDYFNDIQNDAKAYGIVKGMMFGLHYACELYLENQSPENLALLNQQFVKARPFAKPNATTNDILKAFNELVYTSTNGGQS